MAHRTPSGIETTDYIKQQLTCRTLAGQQISNSIIPWFTVDADSSHLFGCSPAAYPSAELAPLPPPSSTGGAHGRTLQFLCDG